MVSGEATIEADSVVAGEAIKFKRSLKLWDKFTIHTKVIGHDEKNFLITQKWIE